MSQHHRGQENALRNLRRELEPQLPLPCIQCGRLVHADPAGSIGPTQWHVGHRTAAEVGGQATRANTGPIHRACNQRDGGQRGAAVTNRRRAAARQHERGMRAW